MCLFLNVSYRDMLLLVKIKNIIGNIKCLRKIYYSFIIILILQHYFRLGERQLWGSLKFEYHLQYHLGYLGCHFECHLECHYIISLNLTLLHLNLTSLFSRIYIYWTSLYFVGLDRRFKFHHESWCRTYCYNVIPR